MLAALENEAHLATVAVDPELCTACGDCAPICPVSAISIPRVVRTKTSEETHA